MRRAAVVAMFGILLVAVAGCGGGGGDDARSAGTSGNNDRAGTNQSVTATTAAAPKTGVDVCALLSAEEVNGLLGGEVQGTPDGAFGAYGVCEWAPPGQGYYQARLTVGPASNYEVLKSKSAEDLAEVGDEAWTRQNQGAGGGFEIGARKGEYSIYADMENTLDNGKLLLTRVFEELGA